MTDAAAQRKAPKRVLACGYYGFGNEGDEAILEGLRTGIRAGPRDQSLEWTVVSGNPTDTARRHNVWAVHWREPSAIVDAVAASDLVLVGGGGLFQDYWGCDPTTMLTPDHSSITFYGLPVLLAALLGKPALLQDVGVGPLSTEEGRSLVRTLVESATHVTVRDTGSRELLCSLGLPEKTIVVSADSTFNLEPDPPPESEIEDRVGVSLRHWSLATPQAEWEALVGAALDRYLDRRSTARLLFVPLQAGGRELEDDFAVAERVRSLLRHRERADTFAIRENPQGAREALSRCRVVLGMRLHAVLFAMATARPVVGLAYDSKVENAMFDAGSTHSLVRLDELPRQDLARMLEEARPVDPARVEALRRRASESSRRAYEVMKSGEPARLTPALGAIALRAWTALPRRLAAHQRDAAQRLERLTRRWETLAEQIQELRAGLRGA